MKKLLLLLLAILTGIMANAQELTDPGDPVTDSTGMPGDNFSLQGALDLFRISSNPEEFEKKLNQEGNDVNNLDLNNDGNTDYIRVIDHTEGTSHALVLQIPVSDKENQDVAVIEIEKTGAETAQLQIIGDEELYGENVFVEPMDENGKKSEKGPSPYSYSPSKIILNVWVWPSVRFIYAPAYVVWVSPYRFGYYPPWFRPWRPHPWHYYHKRRMRYYAGYHAVPVHRVVVAHRVYAPHRNTSVVVRTRYAAPVNRHRAYHAARRTGPAPGHHVGPRGGAKSAPARGGKQAPGGRPGGAPRKGGNPRR